MAIRAPRLRFVRHMLVALLASVMVASSYRTARAQEKPIQTMTAFKTTVYYQYTCVRDVYRIAIGARSQVAIGSEATLYWEIGTAGQTASGGTENVASVYTLPVQSVVSATQAGGFPPNSQAVDVYHPCTGQSLYLWAASGAITLDRSNVIVRFADAIEQPLP